MKGLLEGAGRWGRRKELAGRVSEGVLQETEPG